MNRRFARSALGALAALATLAALTISLCGVPVGAASAGAAPVGTASAGTTHRRFQVRDAVEMADFKTAPLFSPDGRYFVVVTERGRLPEGFIEATLWLFDTQAVQRDLNTRATRMPGAGRATTELSSALAPIPWVQLKGTIAGGGGLNEQTLLEPRWESGSRSLLFLGRDGTANRRLFRVRINDRDPIPLTPPTQDVIDYQAAADSIVYWAGPDISAPNRWASNDPSAPDVVIGTGQPLIHLLYPDYEKYGRTLPTVFEVWRVQGGSAAPVTDATTHQPLRALGSYSVGTLAVSSDATRIVAITYADDIPAAWERYDVQPDPDHRRFRADSPGVDRQSDFSRALQYQLFDLQAGTRRPLLTAPLADFQRGGLDTLQAAWSPDQRYVAISGTYLPLDRGGSSQPSTWACGAAVVDTQTSAVECLIERTGPGGAAVDGVRWASDSHHVVVDSGGTAAEYARHGTRWRLTQHHVRGPTPPPLELKIEQDLDRPPALVATDRRSGHSLALFDPNPQLAAIELGTVSVYTWRDPRGRSITGGLAKPPDFAPGHRYPLVIQTHGFRGDRFFKSGYAETANAGRALAARGLLVLQVQEPWDELSGTWREGTENATNVYLAAIDQLDREGLVDPTKVGVTGYSRAGFYVAKAITDQPDRFAAAVVANADPGSLSGYYTYVDYATPTYIKNAANAFAGAPPYGQDLQKWLERAPGFRTERIRAPVLISAADPQHLLSLWWLYAPLRDQGKPVELQYIRGGQHNLVQPLQKLAHQEMLVDWFDFWLNGHEDPDAVKAEQYAHWHQLRAARDARVAVPHR